MEFVVTLAGNVQFENQNPLIEVAKIFQDFSMFEISGP